MGYQVRLFKYYWIFEYAVGNDRFYYNSTGYESVAVGLNGGNSFGRGNHTPKHSVFVGNGGYY